MNPKILLLALPIVIFSNCSTAYKSGQTPDDVYYSPVKTIEEKQNNDRNEVKTEPAKDYDISMSIRDRRWRILIMTMITITVRIIIATANAIIMVTIIIHPIIHGPFI